MDTVINYNKAASFQKNLPSLEPCPNFTNIWALCKHVIKALSRLFSPQSTIHGWSGLVMDSATYLLSEGTPFIVWVDPGAMAIYPQWVVPTTIKMINVMFLHEKNYFLSYKNIARACFCPRPIIPYSTRIFLAWQRSDTICVMRPDRWVRSEVLSPTLNQDMRWQSDHIINWMQDCIPT